MTLNELQILLALNGNERIDYAEPEIIADVELYTCYLENICSKYDWYEDYHRGTFCELAWVTYKYARFVIKGRWVEAECVIITDPGWAYSYAKFVIKGRFVEAEAVIATDRDYANWYNLEFGTDI